MKFRGWQTSYQKYHICVLHHWVVTNCFLHRSVMLQVTRNSRQKYAFSRLIYFRLFWVQIKTISSIKHQIDGLVSNWSIFGLNAEPLSILAHYLRHSPFTLFWYTLEAEIGSHGVSGKWTTDTWKIYRFTFLLFKERSHRNIQLEPGYNGSTTVFFDKPNIFL